MCGVDEEFDEDGGDGVGGRGLVAFRVVLGVFFPKLGGGCMGIGPLISVLLMCFLLSLIMVLAFESWPFLLLENVSLKKLLRVLCSDAETG